MGKILNQSKLCVLETDGFIQQATIIDLKGRNVLSVHDFSFTLDHWLQIEGGFAFTVHLIKHQNQNEAGILIVDSRSLKTHELNVVLPKGCRVFTVNPAAKAVVYATKKGFAHQKYTNDPGPKKASMFIQNS